MRFIFVKSLLMLVAIPLMASKSNFDSFIQFTVKNFNPPESVARVCDWQYAIVKLHINHVNQVTGYEVLNNVSKDFKSSLSYLKGYQFDKKASINQRHVLFCLSIVNFRMENCDTVGPNHHKLLKGVNKLKEYQANHKVEEKNSIFIYKEFTKQIFDYQK
jgi:hypothetical protein